MKMKGAPVSVGKLQTKDNTDDTLEKSKTKTIQKNTNKTKHDMTKTRTQRHHRQVHRYTRWKD